MPVALRLDGIKFFFYTNEGRPREQAHVHVRSGGAEAKFWLLPQVQLARNDGFDARTLRQIAGMVGDHRELLEKAWNEHFA
ncbi:MULTISPECIES: DUF4160 domain-containing protein [Chromatiaceae]|uniref:DUF4160 domain-containing protein n=1 Tax=Chromatiaceae TaxID=1046 RepID=UPI0025E337AF|nr:MULTISPECIES: DUF4160 domain-containing protein [Chromatiaceae]